MAFTMQEPFYGILLSSMSRREKPEVGTCGIRKTGNSFELLYNRQFIESLPLDEALTVLKHETLHLAFNHFSIWEEAVVSPQVRELRNIASDLEVNCYLDERIVRSLKGMSAADFGFPARLGTRGYFDLLSQMNDEKKQKCRTHDPRQSCNSSKDADPHSQPSQVQSCQRQDRQQTATGDDSSMSSQPSTQSSQTGTELAEEITSKVSYFDDHSEWPDGGSGADAEQIQQIVDTLLDFAAEEVEKAHGTVPGEMEGRIERIRKKPKPVTDWKRYFRRYLGNEFSEFLRKSKKRESRRFPDAAGNRRRKKSNILVAIDTSGSVSMPEYREFFGQIKILSQVADFHVVECDTNICHEYDYKGRENGTLHGGGGTSFQPPIDMFIANRKTYNALVYFTDGKSDIPKNTPKDTLWVISSKGRRDRDRYRINGASVVFIPKHN